MSFAKKSESNFNLDNDDKSGTGISKMRRNKLENIQKREQLKSMLVNKFKNKYGFLENNNRIDDEVSQFVKTEKLTEENLRKLDEKICQETAIQNPIKSVKSNVRSSSITSKRSFQLHKKSEIRKPKTPSIYSEADTASSNKTY
jgi:hypothetical protein